MLSKKVQVAGTLVVLAQTVHLIARTLFVHGFFRRKNTAPEQGSGSTVCANPLSEGSSDSLEPCSRQEEGKGCKNYVLASNSSLCLRVK